MKTPIQELINWVEEIENSVFAISATPLGLKVLSQFKDKFKSKLQQEKEFAKDCFEAGNVSIIKNLASFTIIETPDRSKDFQDFYKQFESASDSD